MKHRHLLILAVIGALVFAALLLWSGRAHARVGLRLYLDVPIRAPWCGPLPPYYYPYGPYYHPPTVVAPPAR